MTASMRTTAIEAMVHERTRRSAQWKGSMEETQLSSAECRKLASKCAGDGVDFTKTGSGTADAAVDRDRRPQADSGPTIRMSGGSHWSASRKKL